MAWGKAWLYQTITLTCWGRDKTAAISQTTFSSAFSWTKMYELKFHWNLFKRVQLTIFQHWFRWLGVNQATSHYLNQWWLDYWHIYASLSLSELTDVDLSTLKSFGIHIKATRNTQAINHSNISENYTSKIIITSTRCQWVTFTVTLWSHEYRSKKSQQ